jgi:hypothetical protein
MRRCRLPLPLRVIALTALPLLAAASVTPRPLDAQGVTTSAIDGLVVDADGQARPGAHVLAVHTPSGTTYSTVSRGDGRFSIPGMRVGGPYRVTVSLIGFEPWVVEDVLLNLGVATNLQVDLRETAIELEGIRVTATDAIFSSERTGAATSVSRQALAAMPTINRRIEDFARLTPQYSGTGFGFSFAGQDNRLNNMTVDGSYFNNSFGLSGQPGDRTGVAPISLDAVEQIHINIAPYDVRQGNFVGAGVNTVTRSGTNQLRGSMYYQHRNEGWVGTDARGLDVDPGSFRFNQIGGWLSGPIIRNRLFYFVSLENEGLTEPATTFRANRGGEAIEGGVTRVEAGVLDQLSSYLATNFGYETGPYQGYDHETPAFRFLTKLDYNIDDRNKLSLRYTHLDSRTDVLASNSSSLGFGNRRSNVNAINFQNSNYIIQENIRSVVGELNSMVRPNMANNLIIGYTYHDESRDSRGTFFPMVDILEAGSTFTTFGFEPFTPNNELRYGSFQLQNNFTIFGPRHSWTFGVSAERYTSENIFFPGSQSVYAYNSLADWYADANDHLNNPNRTTSPVTLRRFQVRWSNIPGQEKPVQPLEVFYTGVYAQNVWQVNRDLKLTLGARIDVPFFGDTGFHNAQVDGMSFRDEDGNTVRYSTDKLPDPNPLFSPRIGFNWDVLGNQVTQLRGGSGIFTGRPAYVWISNQIGENGVLTGFEQIDNTTARPFNPNPHHYKPSNVTGDPAASYGLAFTNPDFRFPQLWRSNIAVDQRLPFGLIGTGEFMYSRDVNGVYYINANLAPANTQFAGADNRPRWTTGNRINSNVTSAVVLKNQNEGYSWNGAFSLERPFADGAFVKAAYSYGEAKNTVNPGSIAFGSWNNNPHAGDPNNPGLGFAATSPGHRVFLAGSYRLEYFNWGATTLSLFWQGYTGGNASYTFAGDINGDGGTSNDLIYIPRDQSEMNFQTYTTGGVTFTAQQQAEAWERFIMQDSYLRNNRGSYVERNAIFLPMVYRADLSIAQDVFTDVLRSRNGMQLRFDILNVANLINSDWGAGYRFTSTQPLIAAGADDQGRAQYRLRAIGGELMSESFQRTAGIGDVYRIQLSVRYTFN